MPNARRNGRRNAAKIKVGNNAAVAAAVEAQQAKPLAGRAPRALVDELRRLGSALGHDTRKRLEGSIDAYYRGNSLYDDRGRLENSTKKVRGLLKKIDWINNWAQDQALDPNLRRDCARFVTRVVRGGNGSKLEDLFRPASNLHGRRQKEGRKRVDLEQHGLPMEHDLGQDFRLKRVTSRGQLKSVGRAYGNCLVKNKYGHHTRLKSGDSAFYVVEHGEGGRGRGLVLEVNNANGEVDHAEGTDRKELAKLAGSAVALQDVLLSVLRHVGGRPDEDGVFGPAGAYVEFLADFDLTRPHARTRLAGKRYCAWADGRVLIIRRGKARWSRFVFDGKRWRTDYDSALDEADLAGLFAPRWPSLGRLVAEAIGKRQVEDDSGCRRHRLPRRRRRTGGRRARR